MSRIFLLLGLIALAACEPPTETHPPGLPMPPSAAEADENTVHQSSGAAAIAGAIGTDADGSGSAESYVDGTAGATTAEPPASANFIDGEFEAVLLSNTRQLVTKGLRSGEGYFSADGERFIYQSEVPGDNPFYQIHLMDLATETAAVVSPGIGLTTCSWVHPTLDRIMFSSTHEDPDALAKQAEEFEIRRSGIDRPYGWDYDRHYEIYQADSDGGNLVNLTNADGYDAEGSYSSDGSKILFASNREAYSRPLSRAEQALLEDDAAYFMDLYIMDADGGNVTQLTFSPGYDGGPFFSPDDSQIVWRRFNPDGNSAEIWTMNIDGSEARQLTAEAMVAWGPYFHPSGEYIIYSSNLLGHRNFELFLIDVDGNGPPVRATNTAGTDILPVFSPDGARLAWSTTRTADGASQIHIGDWDHAAAMRLLGLD